MEKLFKNNEEILNYVTKIEKTINNKDEEFYWQEDMACLINLVKELIRREKIKNSYAEYILDIIYDYDGYYDEETKKGSLEGLKSLIDETYEILNKLINNNTKATMFLGFKNKKTFHYNILHELIKEEDGANTKLNKEEK